MAGALTLIANPGSASRKYALYEGAKARASLHFEWSEQKVICTLQSGERRETIATDITELGEAAGRVVPVLRAQQQLKNDEHITHIGLRIVAPGAYFLEPRLVDDEFIRRLDAAKALAPLHTTDTLAELHRLRQQFADTVITGVSDSAFHKTKPDYAWNYGLPLHDADRLDIKRFGYHGLSVASAVRTLRRAGRLPTKLIVCHIGSGVSVTAVLNGQSFDTSMGYSPLEGAIMATRSGSIDFAAATTLKRALGLDDEQLELYLNRQSGLLGLGGSADLRELLQREAAGDQQAHLAIQTYIFSLQKAIGQMAGALGGLDALVFTGTIGERSAPIRQRSIEGLGYLGLIIATQINAAPHGHPISNIELASHSKPIYIIPADEASEMVYALQH